VKFFARKCKFCDALKMIIEQDSSMTASDIEIGKGSHSRRDFLFSIAAVGTCAGTSAMTSSSDSETVISTYMWRGLASESCERGASLERGKSRVLRGTILRFSDNGPAEVRYEIISDQKWNTRGAQITCSDDLGRRELRIAHKGNRWYANEKLVSLPADCVDIDLAWSPSTNTLPIRRLGLDIGGSSGPLTAAWIRLPELIVEPLRQTYQRTGQMAYTYSSRDGSFKAGLSVDEEGLILNYEGVWDRVDRPRTGGNR
jgi:hypothetical protein